MPPASDEDLMARIRQGDREAFSVLMTRHLPRVFALAFRYFGDRTDAEEIVQEAFLKVWEKPAGWNPERAAFTTWFTRVVINQALDSKRRRSPLPLTHEPEADASNAEDHLLDRERRTLVETELAALGKRQRAALLLCVEEGLSNKEAARIMKISVKALESLLSRGKAALKARLRQKYGDT